MTKIIEKQLKELKETYGLNFYDLDYNVSDDREDMTKQLQSLSGLCDSIVQEFEDEFGEF